MNRLRYSLAPRVSHARTLVVVASLGLAATGGCSSIPEDKTPTPEGKASTVASLVARVADSMGGQKVYAAAAEEIRADGERFEPGEGVHPDRPLFMSTFSLSRTLAAAAPLQRQSLTLDAKAVLPQRVAFTEIINGRAGYLDGNDNIFGSPPQSPLLAGRIAGQLRHADLTSPLRLVRAALAAPSAVTARPSVSFDGHPHEVIALKLGDAPEVRLFVDRGTNLISKAETLEDHPPRGDSLVEVSFKEYRSADGVLVPFDVAIAIDGRRVHHEVRRQAATVPEVDVTKFAVPPALVVPPDEAQATRARRSSQWYAGFFYGAFSFFYYDQTGSPVDDVVLAPGVHYLRGPSHHNLLVEQQDSLTIVDAPMYPGRTSSVLAAAKARFPGKPLRHVIATHFHQDHCGGIRELAAEGNVDVVAGAPTRTFFESIFSNPHSVAPDRFEAAPKPVKVVPVDTTFTIGDPERPIEIYRIPNSHAEDMLITYLPKQKIMFVADLFGPDPATKGKVLEGEYRVWAAELYSAVRSLGLDVQVVVGAHGEGTATLDDVRKGGGQ